MYKVEEGSSSTVVTVRPGLWVRNGHLNGTRHAYDDEFTPLTEAGVASPGSFTGYIAVYALLINSDGYFSPVWAPSSLANESSDWEGVGFGAHGVELLFVETGTWGFASDNAWDPAKQLELIAEIEYSSGSIAEIVPVHNGPIHDGDPLQHGSSLIAGPDDSFLHAKIEYTALTALTVSVAQSEMRLNGYFGTDTVVNNAWTSVDINGNTPAKIYVTAASEDEPSSADKDPSIVDPIGPAPRIVTDTIDAYNAKKA